MHGPDATLPARRVSTVKCSADLALASGPRPGRAQARRLAVVRRLATLAPGAAAVFTFIIAWRVDRRRPLAVSFLTDSKTLRRWYGTKFASAGEVVGYIATNLRRLSAQTELWRRTWYDSTLPHWLLDRTILNVSTLATSTCLRLSNGRFYGWEGTYCCPGTCTHVWQYAQAVARLFPQLERPPARWRHFGLVDAG
jgi:uncharacterized protein (DUF608 family)